MLLLDLFCGAGGAAMGYSRAGFDVVGVDLEPQPNYPFPFVQADALWYLKELASGRRPIGDVWFSAIHASPPCQLFTTLAKLHEDRESYGERHLNLIPETRDLLAATGLPYVIENTPRAPLLDPFTLCGSMFDLPVRRHRIFETAGFQAAAPGCRHERWAEIWPEGFPRDISKARVSSGAKTRSPVVGVYGNGGGPGKVIATWRWAMGTPWMKTKGEIAQSIPPAYTEHIGAQLLAHLQGARAAA